MKKHFVGMVLGLNMYLESKDKETAEIVASRLFEELRKEVRAKTFIEKLKALIK